MMRIEWVTEKPDWYDTPHSRGLVRLGEGLYNVQVMTVVPISNGLTRIVGQHFAHDVKKVTHYSKEPIVIEESPGV